MGWSLGLKATPRKGRSREIEEERKLRAAKKLIFVAEEGEKEAPKSPAELECSLSIMGANPKEGIMTTLRGHAAHSENEGKLPMQIPNLFSPHEGTTSEKVALNDDVGVDLLVPPVPTTPPCFIFNSSKKAPDPPMSGIITEKSGYTKKSRGNKWKRITRDELIDKGEPVKMDTDETTAVYKRMSESELLGEESMKSATKRSKLSTMHDLSSEFPAEVGVTQPRPSL